MVWMVSIPNVKQENNEHLRISPKLCAYIGCVLVLPLANRTHSTVWGFMTPDSISILHDICCFMPMMFDVRNS